METVVGESDSVSKLRARITALPPEKITPDIRAHISVEMVKDAVTAGMLSKSTARQFAESLIQDCGVPVIIGTPTRKIFPIHDIVQAREPVVAKFKQTAAAEGVDYQHVIDIRRQKARDTLQVIAEEYEKIHEKYGLFAQYLSPDQVADELKLQGERIKATRQLLQQDVEPGEVQTHDAAVLDFLQTDVANVYFGQELQEWLFSQ